MLKHATNGSDSDVQKEATSVIINLKELNVTDEIIELQYQIRNNSDRDIWLCDMYAPTFEVFLNDDGKTLKIRRRFDVPTQSLFSQPQEGRYILLRAGHIRTESVVLSLPVQSHGIVADPRLIKDTVYVNRLTIEIGYYDEDLPAIINKAYDEAEMTINKKADKNNVLTNRYLRELITLNERNEGIGRRDEQIVIRYRDQNLKTLNGEQVLQTSVDIQKIPYIGRSPSPRFKPPDLNLCAYVDLQYTPSMLEYFFPYESQQSLFSPSEIQYLQSLKSASINDPNSIKFIIDDVCRSIGGNYSTDGIVCDRSIAQVVCYRDVDKLTSFNVYDDKTIENEQKQRIEYETNLQFLRKLTFQIKPFDRRIRCANNIEDLYYRLRLYHKAQNVLPTPLSSRERWYRSRFYQKEKKAYPSPTKWCDAMIWAYGNVGMLFENIEKPLRCPDAAGGGKCNYAMNPNCKYDSSPDAVLLFETKAGWNQHGGPELFTLDNHDPKGGCVLLNDGTVKFIRTKEELQQLRWK